VVDLADEFYSLYVYPGNRPFSFADHGGQEGDWADELSAIIMGMIMQKPILKIFRIWRKSCYYA